MFTVYAIYNKEADKIYIGQTEDLSRRLNQHNQIVENPSRFTRAFTGDWLVIYSEEYPTRPEAIKREKQLKSYQGRLFLKKLIRA